MTSESRSPSPLPPAPRPTSRIRAALADRALAPVFLVPSLLMLLAVLVGPFLYTVFLSFTDLSYALPDRTGSFVGFDNYRRLVRNDGLFWDSFAVTLKFVLVVVTIEFVLGLAVALLLYHFIERRRVVLTLLLVPMMLAPVTVGLMWKLMLQGEFGMFTHYLRELGVLDRHSAVLGDATMARLAIVLIDIWQWTPFVTLVLLAGMLGLPRAPFEAAVMDGAGPLRVFRDIMLPMLKPIIALVVLLRGIDAFKEFDKVFILTGGGPGTATELLSIYTYRVNFRDWDLGYGAVCAFMVYLVVLILCAVFYKVMHAGQERTAP